MISRIAVVIPAADEQDVIGDCLRSVHAARRRLHAATRGTVRSRVVVVLDGCTDATAAIVRGFPDVETVVTQVRCVGLARRAGASYALGIDRPIAALWLANTDADCIVPVDWLSVMAELAGRGTDLVVGTARPDDKLGGRARTAWSAAHHVRDDHPHVHGANLGIAARRYLELDGWAALRSDEDVDLVTRAVSCGHLRILRTGSIPVTTSSRLRGRAPDGFADYLRALNDLRPDLQATG